MAHIFEISKHSDHYLVHHFQFECNDGKVFGNYVGNWTLNKFMSLHDWHQIFISLNTPIQHYIAKPTKRPTQTKQHIGDTNFELNIAWVKMDASIYSKLFTGIDFSLVFPYVIKVRVSLRSNVDKFRDGVDVSLESQAHEAVATTATAGTTDTTSNRQRTLKRSAVQPSVQEPSKPANGPARTPIELRECCVRLPLLQFDENGQVIQAPETNQQQQPPPQPVRNSKRKFSSIANVSQINSMNLTPIRNGGENSGFGAICAADTSHCFQASSSSTPFIRKVNGGINGSGSAKQKRQRMPPTQRLTMSTPVSSQDRKTGSTQFNPRIRLLKMPENVSKLNISAKNSKRKIRGPDKKSTKINGKTKTASGKVIKKKKKKVIRVIPNESQLFETPPPPPNRMSKKVVASANAADASAVVIISPLSSTETTPTTPAKETNNDNEEMTIIPCNGTVKAEYLDLKSLTEQELWKSFDDNFELVSNLFVNYLRQTDPAVRTAGDYEPFDIISLLTTDQFSIMLDILFEKLVKIGEFGEINYDALFMKSLIPEWILAMFMQQNAFDRGTAIAKIVSQRMQSDQNHEQYTSLINVRLDETANVTRA